MTITETVGPSDSVDMGVLQEFLETSTIHGLYYVGTAQKSMKIFWILVVTVCFFVASILIIESFNKWTESPVATTIETLPIKDFHAPKERNGIIKLSRSKA